MDFLKNNKWGLGITGALAMFALVFGVTYYKPATTKLEALRKNRIILEAELSERRSAIEKAIVPEFHKPLISEEMVSVAINELTRQGIASGVKFSSITPRTIIDRTDTRYRILPIELEIDSTYEGLGLFLGTLETAHYCLITVDSFFIYPNDMAPSRLKTKLVIHLHLMGLKNG